MTPSQEALWNIAVHRPKDRPAPTPVNRLGPFFKREHKYHPARLYRLWEFKPTPPGEAYDISGLEGFLAPVGSPIAIVLLIGIVALFVGRFGRTLNDSTQQLFGLVLFLWILFGQR